MNTKGIWGLFLNKFKFQLISLLGELHDTIIVNPMNPSHHESMFFWVLLLYGALVLNIGLFRGEIGINKFFELNDSKTYLIDTIENIRTENKNLTDEINKILESQSYAKKVLKEKYHIKNANEEIIFLTE